MVPEGTRWVPDGSRKSGEGEGPKEAERVRWEGGRIRRGEGRALAAGARWSVRGSGGRRDCSCDALCAVQTESALCEVCLFGSVLSFRLRASVARAQRGTASW